MLVVGTMKEHDMTKLHGKGDAASPHEPRCLWLCISQALKASPEGLIKLAVNVHV